MSDFAARGHEHLGPGREFDVIRELVARWGDVAQGIGDDAAVLDAAALGATHAKLVISTDAMVEHVHFEREWMSPFDIGVRAAAAALSDLAAMGASATAVLVALIVPPQWRSNLLLIGDGIAQVVRASGARIVGGNVSAGDLFSCTLTVLGVTAAPVLRGGARPSDALMVTGVLGGPGAALRAWQAGAVPAEWARRRFVAPSPRLAEGAWLASQGVHAMIDISDGLGADARHLAAASGLACDIDLARIPRFPAVAPAEALASGEEYELLVAVAADRGDTLSVQFEAQFGLPLTIVGRLSAPSANTDPAPRVEFPLGHDHFSR